MTEPDSNPRTEHWYLVGVSGTTRSFPLQQDVVVGSAPGADVLVRSPEIAARHFRLVWADDGWRVEPLEGVADVVGDRSGILSHGATVSVGGVTLRLERHSKLPAVRLNAAWATTAGRRGQNDDDAHADRRLVAVADGVAGASGGGVAAATVLSVLASAFKADSPDSLVGAAEAAAEAVRRVAASTKEHQAMATTLTAVALVPGSEPQIAVVHAGDSRAYLLRNNILELLTADHATADGHLTRVVDGPVRFDHVHRPVFPGDRLVVVSDGVRAAMDDSRLAALVATGTPQQAADTVAAAAADGPDNATVAIADVTDLAVVHTHKAGIAWVRGKQAAEFPRRAPLAPTRKELVDVLSLPQANDRYAVTVHAFSPDRRARVVAVVSAAAVGITAAVVVALVGGTVPAAVVAGVGWAAAIAGHTPVRLRRSVRLRLSRRNRDVRRKDYPWTH